MKSAAKAPVLVLNQERTEEEIVEAMQEFAIASVGLVGHGNTYETIKFLTNTISESPHTYQKVLTPKVLGIFAEISEKSKSSKMGVMEIMAAMSEVQNALK